VSLLHGGQSWKRQRPFEDKRHDDDDDVLTESEEAKGLESELEWMSEMTEDEYNELTPRTRDQIDRIRLHLNKERLNKYSTSLPRLPSR